MADCENTDETQELNVFDKIGDIFWIMTKGILVFAFCKLPVFIWRNVFNMKLFHFVKSFSRMILMIGFWLAIVFGIWMLVDFGNFITVLGVVLGTISAPFIWSWHYIKEHAIGIWIAIALLGSAYGLVYISIKRRKNGLGEKKMGSQGEDVNQLVSEEVQPVVRSEGSSKLDTSANMQAM